jgi:hypothetical protein
MAKFKILKFPAKCPFPEKSSLAPSSITLSRSQQKLRHSAKTEKFSAKTEIFLLILVNFKLRLAPPSPS